MMPTEPEPLTTRYCVRTRLVDGTLVRTHTYRLAGEVEISAAGALALYEVLASMAEMLRLIEAEDG